MDDKTKKKESKSNSKTRQIIDIVVTAVQVVIVIFCIVMSIIIWTGNEGDPLNRKINWFAILTDSMTRQSDDFYAEFETKYGVDIDVKKSTFDPGDMVFTKKVAFEDIKVGDVIAYKYDIIVAGEDYGEQVVTHRVIEIDEYGQTFTTQGDRDHEGTQQHVVSYKVVFGKMTGQMKGVGGAILWLQGYRKGLRADGSTAYIYSGSSATFLIIIIPLAALFIYNGFFVVKWVLDERMKKVKEAAEKEAAEKAAQNLVNQQDLERKAVRAFMAAQGMTDEQIDEYFAKEDAKKAASLEAEKANNAPQETSESAQDADVSTESSKDEEAKDIVGDDGEQVAPTADQDEPKD